MADATGFTGFTGALVERVRFLEPEVTGGDAVAAADEAEPRETAAAFESVDDDRRGLEALGAVCVEGGT